MSRYSGWRRFAPLLWLLIAAPSLAVEDRGRIAAICESAAQLASRESGVPLDVLRAISLTETGRRKNGAFLPWPWTVNMEGIGKWFDTVDQAQAYVDRHFRRGARSFDVGCFQINYRWHGHAFDSIEDMFDPITNARYAAAFLSDLFTELGDWSSAAGAYHSRTPKYAKKYKARFDRIRVNLTDPEPLSVQVPRVPEPVVARQNQFPLLQPGSRFSPASLVPLNGSSARFIDVAGARPLLERR